MELAIYIVLILICASVSFLLSGMETGVFSLKDTHATLARLPTILPVKLRYISRYWVSVEPA